MSQEDGVKIAVMQGRTPLGWRLAMVAGVDRVLTISGSKHTEVVGEQALELGIPFFPIPSARGDSEDLLDRHRARIALAFAPGALDHCLSILSNTITKDIKGAVTAVVELAKTAKFGKCLVLLPYDGA